MHHIIRSLSSLLRAPEVTASSSRLSIFSWRVFIGYCLIVLGFISMSGISGDRYWPVQAFGYVRDIALLIALLPLPIVLWRRLRKPVVLQLLCAILLVWTPANASDLPRVAPEGSTELTIMTLNTGNDVSDPAKLMSVIDQSGADIIGLQEVSPETAEAIESVPTTEYPYHVVYGLGIPGKALLSKFPIVDHQLLDANPDRPDLLVTLDIHGTRTTVIVAHPPPPHLTSAGVVSRPGANEQFAALVDAIAQADGPLLVMGDFNITQHHDRYELLKSMGLVDAFAESGNGTGNTYPSNLSALVDVSQSLSNAPMLPLLRIDYIWSSSDWYPVHTSVADNASSDHLPLVARMAFLPAQPAISLP